MNKQKQAQINELLENHAGSFETPVYNRRNQCLQHAKLPFIQKTKTLICLNPDIAMQNEETKRGSNDNISYNSQNNSSNSIDLQLNCIQKYKCNSCLVSQAETENIWSTYSKFWRYTNVNVTYPKNSHTWIIIHLETHIKNYSLHKIESYLNFSCLKLAKNDIKYHQTCRISCESLIPQCINIQGEIANSICIHGIYKISEQIIVESDNNNDQANKQTCICGYIALVTCDSKVMILKYLINLENYCNEDIQKSKDNVVSLKLLAYEDTNISVMEMNDIIIDLKVSSEIREFSILTQSGFLHTICINEVNCNYTITSLKLNCLKGDDPNLTVDFTYQKVQPVFNDDDDMQVDSDSQLSIDESQFLCVPVVGFDYGYANGIFYGITDYSILLINANK